jgi:hypothetical protein
MTSPDSIRATGGTSARSSSRAAVSRDAPLLAFDRALLAEKQARRRSCAPLKKATTGFATAEAAYPTRWRGVECLPRYPYVSNVTFEDWRQLSDEERRDVAATWNPYAGEGNEIVAAAAERLRSKLTGDIEVHHGVYHGGDWIIRVTVPFVFDRRSLPESFLGIRVMHFSLDLPPEFRVRDSRAEYVWAPERYELFVDRAAQEIRGKLGRADMSREEMLDALCGMNFEAHKARCRQGEKDGKIPPFRGLAS